MENNELWNRIVYHTALYRLASQNRTIETSQELRDYHFDHIARFELIKYRTEYITLARLCAYVLGILSSEFYVIRYTKLLPLILVMLIIRSTLELTLRMLDTHIDDLCVVAIYALYGICGIYGLLVLSVYFRHT